MFYDPLLFGVGKYNFVSVLNQDRTRFIFDTLHKDLITIIHLVKFPDLVNLELGPTALLPQQIGTPGSSGNDLPI